MAAASMTARSARSTAPRPRRGRRPLRRLGRDLRCRHGRRRLSPSDDLPGPARPPSRPRPAPGARRRRRHRADRRMAEDHRLSHCRGSRHFRRNARRRGGKRRLQRAAPRRPRHRACRSTTEHFAGIVSAGVFTTGHVGAEGLDDLVRICRPGGVIVLTVKTTLWEDGFASHLGDACRLAHHRADRALRLDARRGRHRPEPRARADPD